MNFKVGSYYKVSDRNDPKDWDISYVSEIDNNMISFVIVKKSPQCSVEVTYAMDMNYALEDVKVEPVTYYKSKLGKILYGSK